MNIIIAMDMQMHPPWNSKPFVLITQVGVGGGGGGVTPDLK